jgi:hypothetical protein
MSLLQNQTQVNPDTSFFSPASGGGGGGTVSSFASLSCSTLVVAETLNASTITVGTSVTGNNFMRANTFFSGASTFNAAANSSTLMFSTDNPGMYLVNANVATSAVNNLGLASLDSVSATIVGANNYARVANIMNISTASFTIATEQPGPGNAGSVDYYFCNTSNVFPSVPVSINWLQIG